MSIERNGPGEASSMRLGEELAGKLDIYSQVKDVTKTMMVKEALQKYFADEEALKDSYESGESLFGRYGSGKGDLSENYKQILKEKLSVRHRS